MLDKADQHRLAAIRGVVAVDKKEGVKYAENYKLEMIDWLAEELKKADDELRTLKRSKQDISDRWYPR